MSHIPLQSLRANDCIDSRNESLRCYRRWGAYPSSLAWQVSASALRPPWIDTHESIILISSNLLLSSVQASEVYICNQSNVSEILWFTHDLFLSYWVGSVSSELTLFDVTDVLNGLHTASDCTRPNSLNVVTVWKLQVTRNFVSQITKLVWTVVVYSTIWTLNWWWWIF